MRIVLLSLLCLLFTQTNAQPPSYEPPAHSCYAQHQQLNEMQIKAMEAATVQRSDTFDVLHYEAMLDLSNWGAKYMEANCKVDFTPKMSGLNFLRLDLLNYTVDSILFQGNSVPFSRSGYLLDVNLPITLMQGTNYSVTVFYQGNNTPDPNGWGGFHWAPDLAYHLGIAFGGDPYNFGRAWHPCFDNFTERATYDITVRTIPPKIGYAIGALKADSIMSNGKRTRHFKMDKPLPTYLVSFAAANFTETNINHNGLFGPIPIQWVARSGDMPNMVSRLAHMPQAVDDLQKWYGPFVWSRLGYVNTPTGAMEHPTLTAYTIPDGTPEYGTSVHELGHYWFGDMVTLRTASDMWIKEGNAEYASHIFLLEYFGKQRFLREVLSNHAGVLRQAHQVDGDYLPLSGIPVESAYGRHTYRKGASMMHNLRTYLGDNKYKLGLQTLIANRAYGAVNADEFKTEVATAAGYDLDPFFDGWIYNPGYPHWEIMQTIISPSQIGYGVQLIIKQDLLKAPALFEDVPMKFTLRGEDGNAIHKEVRMIGGLHDTLNFNIVAKPTSIYMNELNHLNIAETWEEYNITAPGEFPFTDYNGDKITVTNVRRDSVYVRVEHNYVAPPPIDYTNTARISKSHYWTVHASDDQSLDGSIKIFYDRKSVNNFFDTSLLKTTEDSLILVYRPNMIEPWTEHSNYSKNVLGIPNDGLGFVETGEILAGHYAFANGTLPLFSSTTNVEPQIDWSVQPNPVHSSFEVKIQDVDLSNVILEVSDLKGQSIARRSIDQLHAQKGINVQCQSWPSGSYFVRLENETGQLIGLKKIIKH